MDIQVGPYFKEETGKRWHIEASGRQVGSFTAPKKVLFYRLNPRHPVIHPRSLTARPWKMVGQEDDPFLLGPGNFSGENSLLNFRGVPPEVKGV